MVTRGPEANACLRAVTVGDVVVTQVQFEILYDEDCQFAQAFEQFPLVPVYP